MRQYSQRPWYNDVRSKQFSHNRFFGVAAIPTTLGRSFYPPLNQGQTMECAAFAAAQNGRYLRGVEMEPQWQVSKISRLQGFDVATQGSNPNSAMDSQLVIKTGGYLPKTLYIARQEAALDIQASNYGDAAYLKVMPAAGQDYFDAIYRPSFYPSTSLPSQAKAFRRSQVGTTRSMCRTSPRSGTCSATTPTSSSTSTGRTPTWRSTR